MTEQKKHFAECVFEYGMLVLWIDVHLLGKKKMDGYFQAVACEYELTRQKLILYICPISLV